MLVFDSSLARIALLAIALMLVVAPRGLLTAQQDPPPGERETIDALLDMLDGRGQASLEEFARTRLTPAYVATFADGGAIEHLAAIREATVGTLGDVGVQADDEGLIIRLSDMRSIELRAVVDVEAGRFSRLEVLTASEDGSGDAGPATSDREAAERHFSAIEAIGMEPEGAEVFVAEHLSPEMLESMPEAELAGLIDVIRRATASAGSFEARLTPDGYALVLRGGLALDIYFSMETQAPFRIRALRADTDVSPEGTDTPEEAPISWENLPARLEAAEAEGFAGTVLAIRGGEIVLSESYGLADIAASRPTTSETIYAIGSMPIDFTRAAIFLLSQDGALDLDDPIGTFLSDVPDDKAAMTVRHLMSGRSGLPNFHHRSSVDADPDLTWIDRATAEERILAQRLLFAPGEGSAQSHSAFVLLSAIIERVSGDPYANFLKTRFFEPAGMGSTGFFGETLGVPESRFATGYGSSAVGDPNIPPKWGPTSWLVMGSGGMVSTPADMYAWFRAMRSGAILRAEMLDQFLRGGVGMGGSDRGFFFLRAWDGQDDLLFLASNAGNDSRQAQAMVRALARLVLPESGG